MKVLSLFDGMACGHIALDQLDVAVDRYVAYEVDKYATKVATHNFNDIEQRGDVFQADFTEFQGFDWLIGGSPCTYWSIAQKNNRETEASGLGWELFSQYVRALHEAKPKMFLYENNKSMSRQIRASITEIFGFEPICINSALVSAQNRNRLYWVGIRQDDGTYRKADIQQPEDRGILLKDVLDGAVAWHEKSFALTTRCQGAIVEDTLKKHRHTMVAEPVRIGSLPRPNGELSQSQAFRIYSQDGKSVNLTAQGGGAGAKTGLYAIPCLRVPEATKIGYTEIIPGNCVDLTMPNSKTRRGRNMRDKSNCVMTGCQYYQYCGTINQPIYRVENGQITIKGKQYPIKLIDGYYIIRKLTVAECKRLQTVPDWYDMSVISNSQAYKCLGNGWTIAIIMHLVKSATNNKKPEG